MDLDLFDAFNGVVDATILSAKTKADSSIHEGKSKRFKISKETIENENIVEISKVDDELVFTDQTTTLDEKGTLTKFSAVPVDYVSHQVESNQPVIPAKIYPFKLDPFQQEAVNYIERNESVLVAAHTSAGKTAVAEYAIAKSLKNKQRVIYTSPIKALSNQKFRDLQEEFSDVGLMTGDMTINPNATCIIMTTEILRNMLYRGSEMIREVAWVIYDEVHYMRDKERGVVWEESIILLPHNVRFVFLSATIPNAREFVGWVAKTHHQPCHVVYTDYRPVPLQHFLFPSGGEGLYLVVDDKSKFREDNFQRAMACLHNGPPELEEKGGGKNRRKSGGKQQNTDLFQIVKLIMDRNLDPCIVFSFSKRDCENYALQMARLNFNSDEEKHLVEQVFLNAMEALSDDDKRLPQVSTILPLLRRGVGIHHGGLLPILKEVIEILFQEGLIKCLFATETFSIGINMPAKTVVFTNTRKYDGQDFRWITSGEYIQMSGRAGRRGKDDKGIVIQMLEEKMEPDVAKGILYGAPDPLFSSYHVSYNMVLNMLRVEDADPENLLRLSFHQYQQEQQAPELEKQAEELQNEATSIVIEQESEVGEYFSWGKQLQRAQSDILSVIRKPKYSLPYLQNGRLVRIKSSATSVVAGKVAGSSPVVVVDAEGGVDWGWGVIVNHRKSVKNSDGIVEASKDKKNSQTIIGYDANPNSEYILDVLLEVLLEPPHGSNDPDASAQDTTSPIVTSIDGIEGINVYPSSVDDKSRKSGNSSTLVMVILQVTIECLFGISVARINLPKDLRKGASRSGVQKVLAEILKRFSQEGIPCMDPVTDMGIVEDSFKDMTSRAAELQSRLKSSRFHNTSNSDVALANYTRKVKLLEEARKLKQLLRESQMVAMREDLKRMKRVLKRLGYITPDGVLETKGRFACELSTGDELVLTDMVFEGVFNELTVPQTVALLSCFVHQDVPKEKIFSEVQSAYTQLQNIARKIVKIRIDAKIVCDEEEFVNSFNGDLMEVTFRWSAGSSFVEICKLTEVFEGSIVRVIRRLEELLRQLASASIAIGNHELKAKFEAGADSIRRGVVFAASLYL